MTETNEAVEVKNDEEIPDFFEVVGGETFEGGPVKILVNSSTTANYKTIIEQSQEEDFRIMTERELNRRLGKIQGHWRVESLEWNYNNEKDPKASTEIVIVVGIRPAGIEDL